ncbi:NADPH:quinone reductase-like Zn-dependent oxidoreductase [Mycobacterium frederiksbergense]|uniref:enoyl-[acyl-carrier-protein] reductase n=1 Tax=Mycolicibacterium frederiksbergense TaxID=117567 RepID=A0ABT6L141_9MYCO|nr:zinc-dependent alcohol dehydrogenase family protein [Mycolicibacterium frederiksbergense]MDH6196665.1 NADPH:quinone reductase-like Zn-dependent oxidoreductase [Mycolicibacterium frederiksbergense]
MSYLKLSQFGAPEDSVALADAPDRAPGPREVVVRIEAAAINPSDLLLIQGRYLARPQLPAAVGAEGVGIVAAVGAEVDDALVGKRVIVLPTYTYGTWSDMVVADRDDVVEVPGDDPLQLAMLTINPVTAHLLLQGVGLQIGDWVGQTAANSAVGRHVIALARRRGLKTLNLVRREEAAEEVRSAGGDAVLVSGPDLAADIAGELGGARLGLVLDPLGGTSAAELIGALGFGGTVVTYGTLTAPPVGPTPADLFTREVRHTGFWLGNWYARAPRAEIVATLQFLARLVAGKELVTPVEATYPIEQFGAAFAHAQASQRAGKVLFTFGDLSQPSKEHAA